MPPGLLPEGWSITVSAVSLSDREKSLPLPKFDNTSPSSSSSSSSSSSDGQCLEEPSDEDLSQLASLAFNMVIRDSKNRIRSLEHTMKVAKSRHGLELKLTFVISSKQEKRLRAQGEGLGGFRFSYLGGIETE